MVVSRESPGITPMRYCRPQTVSGSLR
jgi:hypothetical protein